MLVLLLACMWVEQEHLLWRTNSYTLKAWAVKNHHSGHYFLNVLTQKVCFSVWSTLPMHGWRGGWLWVMWQARWVIFLSFYPVLPATVWPIRGSSVQQSHILFSCEQYLCPNWHPCNSTLLLGSWNPTFSADLWWDLEAIEQSQISRIWFTMMDCITIWMFLGNVSVFILSLSVKLALGGMLCGV